MFGLLSGRAQETEIKKILARSKRGRFAMQSSELEIRILAANP
jgi:hypothetical protein